MPSFLTRERFGELTRIRQGLLASGSPPATPEAPGLAGLFVPWAGARLAEEGGIYWIGAGTEGEYGAAGEQSFEACHERAARLCDRGEHGRAHTPTWMFLDALTRALLGGPYDATSDRWGWSNLLKLGWSAGGPESWPSELIERQQAVCAAALREEVGRLRDSLVFIGSLDDFGILGEALGGVPGWHGRGGDETGIWWLRDEATGNLLIHGSDPGAARRGQFSEVALERIVLLARNMLPHLA